MQISIYSWDAHLINDTTNYTAWFPRGLIQMPSAYPMWAMRSKTFPKLANKSLDGGVITFNIECKGTFHSQAETLKQWFKVDDYTLRTLIVKDTADSNRQWYVEGFPTEPVKLVDGAASIYQVTLALIEPFWRTVTGQTVNWSVTASGQTKALSVLGNNNARPIFTITATAGKVGGYAYAKAMPWYNPYTINGANNMPLDVTNGGLSTSALVADNSNKCLVNVGGGISAVVTTIPYDTVTGTIPSSGLIYIDTEQISYTGKTGTTSGNITGCVRGVNGTSAATHADNAVIYVSKIMANGYDLRVYVDGAEVDCWKTGINTASTKIWINQTSSAQPYLFLGTTIASSGSVTSITLQNPYPSQGNKIVASELAKLPNNFAFAIGTEIFNASAVDVNGLTITVSGRAAKNTSMAAHAIGDRVYWMEHDIYLVYGNPSAVAPYTNDSKKPMIDLTNSTNTSWVYTEFYSASQQRTAAWTPTSPNGASLSAINNIGFVRYIGSYTGPHATWADPATEAGVAANTYAFGGTYRTSSGHAWTFSHPAGIATVTVTGVKYRYTTDWPTFTMYCGATLFTEATPSAANTWESLSSHSGITTSTTVSYSPTSSITTYPGTLQLLVSGTLSSIVNNYAAVELQSATITFPSTGVMQLLTTIAENTNFFMDSTIANSTTGEAISIQMPMETNKVLVIDCDAETVVYDGKDIGLPIRWNTVRGPWLDITPGANTLTYTDTGTVSGLTISVAWEDRNTL